MPRTDDKVGYAIPRTDDKVGYAIPHSDNKVGYAMPRIDDKVGSVASGRLSERPLQRSDGGYRRRSVLVCGLSDVTALTRTDGARKEAGAFRLRQPRNMGMKIYSNRDGFLNVVTDGGDNG